MSVLIPVLAALLAAAFTNSDGESVWPAFLGQGARIVNPSQLPTTWSPKEGLLWTVKTPGHGQSSPVSWGDKVFLTATDGPKKDTYHVLCFAANDGKVLWDYTLENSDPVENSIYVSRAAPTPVVDKDLVITFFESGDVLALDHAGKSIWKTNITEKTGKFKNKFGLSGSPVQNQRSIFILVDDEGPSYLLALDKATGKEVWRQERTSRNSWSSPAMHSIDGLEQVVVSSAGSVDGYECGTGKLLWTYTDVGGNTACTPVSVGNGKFLIAASAGRDGGNTEVAKKSNAMMQVTKTDNTWKATVLWKAEEATPSWASPIVHQGCAYWVNTKGLLYCFDIETGKLNYKERLKQSCWATPLGAGERIYFFGKDGLTAVIAAGKEFRSIAENELWDPNAVEADKAAGAKESTEERRNAAAMFSGPTQYGYAVVGNKIVMRTGDTLFCIGK